MNKYEVKKGENQEYPYIVSVLTSVNGVDFCYSGNGRFCKTFEEAIKFANDWEADSAMRQMKDQIMEVDYTGSEYGKDCFKVTFKDGTAKTMWTKSVSFDKIDLKQKAAEYFVGNINTSTEMTPEEVIDKSFDIVEEFYQHLTEASQPITEQNISDMQWVLDNIVSAIKADKENHIEKQDDEFGKCDGWNHGFSSLMILGATRQQVIKQAKTRDDWENIFLNYSDCSDGSIVLDAYRINPKDAADFFCEIGPSVRVYASWHWDEDVFVARCNNKDYHGFTAKFTDGMPHYYDDDEGGYYDVEVEITDKESGCVFVTGGGMCTEEEVLFYQELVTKHSK